ncbi:MAG: hypothetical protein U0869_19855 [Chloroflexota bacterium]
MRRRSLLCVPAALLVLALPGSVVAQSPSPDASARPASPAVTLLAQSIDATRKASAMHISLSGTGSMAGADGPASLDGATFEADLDIADRAMSVEAALPSMGMPSVALRILGDQAYLKAPGLTDGDTWMTTDAGMLVDLMAGMIPGGRRILNGDPDLVRIETIIQRRLDKASGTIAIAGDQPCGAGTCSTIHIESPEAASAPSFLGLFGSPTAPASLAPLASIAPGAPGMTIDLLVDTATQRLDSVTMSQHSDQGDLTVTITMSAYDAPVTIEAPPADQVSGSSFD